MLNLYQQDVFDSLMNLIDGSGKKFFFREHELDGHVYRVFSYHMASYTDWLEPHALECRGVMFRMEGETPTELVSLPFPKFFNFMENPFTMDLDFSKALHFEEKADGSLISTYNHDGEMRLKSKTSLSSIMANEAMNLINQDKHADFKNALTWFNDMDWTVIMEWCNPHPDHRIVLFYEEPQLRVFGLRHNLSGIIIDYLHDDVEQLISRDLGVASDQHVFNHLAQLKKYSVERFFPDDPESFMINAKGEVGIEGYIMVMEGDMRVKRKTDWYCTQHKLKDTVTNREALFMAVIHSATDDLKSIFYDNPHAVKVINAMEEFATPIYMGLINDVENFHEENRDLDRKSYAIKGQEELATYQFGCAMQIYLGKEVDYQKVMEKNAKMFVQNFTGDIIAEGEE